MTVITSLQVGRLYLLKDPALAQPTEVEFIGVTTEPVFCKGETGIGGRTRPSILVVYLFQIVGSSPFKGLCYSQNAIYELQELGVFLEREEYIQLELPLETALV